MLAKSNYEVLRASLVAMCFPDLTILSYIAPMLVGEQEGLSQAMHAMVMAQMNS